MRDEDSVEVLMVIMGFLYVIQIQYLLKVLEKKSVLVLMEFFLFFIVLNDFLVVIFKVKNLIQNYIVSILCVRMLQINFYLIEKDEYFYKN